MNINDFKTQPELETKGVWRPFEDAKFLIAANQNPAHKKCLAKLGRQNQRALRKQDDAAIEAMAIKAQAECVLLGWEGVFDGKNPLPYSVEAAEKLLRIGTFREFVSAESMNIENFMHQAEGVAQADLKSGAQVASPLGTE